MTKVVSTAVVAVTVSLLGSLSAISPMPAATPRASAAPASEGAIVMPMSSAFRACDHSALSNVGSVGSAQVVARLANAGGGTLVAVVDIAAAPQNSYFDVRVIQMPRPSIGCGPGAPGVLVGGLQTGDNGASSTTLQGPIRPGATGAWVIVERAAEYSQTPAEFYTTTFVASI